MPVYLKYLDEKIETKFKEIANERYPGKKNSEKLLFTDLINFISSESGKKVYEKWFITTDEFY